MAERNFEFRKRLNTVHLTDRRDPAATPLAGETEIADGWRIAIPAGASEYLTGVAKDLQDYLFTSMGVSTLLVHGAEGGQVIRLTTDGAEGLSKPRSYRLSVGGDSLTICGLSLIHI